MTTVAAPVLVSAPPADAGNPTAAAPPTRHATSRSTEVLRRPGIRRTFVHLVACIGPGPARAEARVSQAEIARIIGADPSVVRRLLTSAQRNPSLGTVAEIAAALGLKLSLVPMSEDEQRELAELRESVGHGLDRSDDARGNLRGPPHGARARRPVTAWRTPSQPSGTSRRRLCDTP